MKIIFVVLHCINSVAAITFVVPAIALFIPMYLRARNNNSYQYFSKCLAIIISMMAAFTAFAIVLNFSDGLSNFDVAGYVCGIALIAWLVIVYPIDIGIIVTARKCNIIESYGNRISLIGNREIFGVSLFISGFLSIILSLTAYCIILVFNLA
jgi:hypothetical protein